MKNRIKLVEYFKELGFKQGVEIGVCDGRFSEVLCQIIPDLKLFSIDSWSNKEGIVIFEKAKKRLKPYNIVIINKTSMEALTDIPNESLDFVFIDANHHYECVRDDIREWSKKVKIGGIVSGHDYYVTPHGNKGVIQAVDEYTKEWGYKLELTNWDKENPVEDDRQPSWYFIKNK